MSTTITYPFRYVARVILEATTALRVGTGEKGIYTDALVIRDVNSLPYIPGTSIVGVLRHSVEDGKRGEEKRLIEKFFGFQKAESGRGSQFICSSAHLVGKKDRILDGLQEIDWSDSFYRRLINLPIRQHVRINEKGCNTQSGKFDEEVVYKGIRFGFEMEFVSESIEEVEQFKSLLLPAITHEQFRLGSGTRKGFGALKVSSLRQKRYDLRISKDLEEYLAKSSDLSQAFHGDETNAESYSTASGWKSYTLKLKPQDFFLFGSGFSDNEADMIPVKEEVVHYQEGEPSIQENYSLIPATSVKGAIAHRTAFYYNQLTGNYATAPLPKGPNKAVTTLFGSEEGNKKSRGNVLFSDLYINHDCYEEKRFNHVAIDRFTGGAIEGALFNEKAVYLKPKGATHPLTLKILVEPQALSDEKIKEAFEKALKDLCTGYLPLGGGVNRGHGLFNGVLETENQE